MQRSAKSIRLTLDIVNYFL